MFDLSPFLTFSLLEGDSLISWSRLISSRLPKEAENSQKRPSSSKSIKESETHAYRAQLSRLDEWKFYEDEKSVEEAILEYVRDSKDMKKTYKPFPPVVWTPLMGKESPIHMALNLGPIRYLNQHFGETAKWSTEVITEVDKRQVSCSILQADCLSGQSKPLESATTSSSRQPGRMRQPAKAREHALEEPLCSSSAGKSSLRQDFVLKAIDSKNTQPKNCCSSTGSRSRLEEFVMVGEVKRAEKLSFVEKDVRKVGDSLGDSLGDV